MIFPEGGRSRTGRVNRENFSYSVGRFLDENPNCRVMLVYLRGDGQETWGLMPRLGEHFTMNVEVFDPGEGRAEACASNGNTRGGSSSAWPIWRTGTLPGVGNDVVDLKEPDNRGKSGDDRFLARVFTAEEREQIAQAAAPDTLLWSLWAAKEAAYKAVSGGDPGAVCSIPRRYPVHLDGESAAGTKAPVAGRGDSSPDG